ncbi:MAG TPA: hypothetical protein VIX89_12080 [Bryobacteraceae bacterium]
MRKRTVWSITNVQKLVHAVEPLLNKFIDTNEEVEDVIGDPGGWSIHLFWSEDLTDGRRYGTVTVRSPFR